MNWHTRTREDIFKELSTDESGLSAALAARRLAEVGENRLPEPKRTSWSRLFIRQFESPLIYILLIAAAIVFLMGDMADSIVIAAVLLVNAIIGTLQEGKAESAISALRNFVKTDAVVIREGREMVVDDLELVPGDLILLKEGDKIPSDARIISEESFKVEEAALTGESEAVMKTALPIEKPDIPPAEMKNMVFKGTFAVAGLATAVVVATGTRTEIGKISLELASLDTEIPLKADIRTLSRAIIAVVLATVILMFCIGLVRGIEAREMFSVVVAVAVSAIPEGLPVVVTLILATGVYRMGKRNALVKRLQAVEALGQADIIAVDKTGTITRNQMMVEEVYADGTSFKVIGNGYEPKGKILNGESEVEPLDHPELILAGKAAALTSSGARFAYIEERKEWDRISGDPTEVALLVFSEKIGFSREALLKECAKILEVPFDSRIKYHAVEHDIDGVPTLFVAGAPEVIIESSTHITMHGSKGELGKSEREELYAVVESMSSRGLRVIALAVREHAPKNIDPSRLPELSFIAFAGIADALREDVFASVSAAEDAGVKVVMITGDHATTARAIAERIGIYKNGDEIVTGRELEMMSESDLARKARTISIFARVTPEHKLKIIQAYKSSKLIVAMTGDGVNDALSLSAADLGVSMGKIGTEVAKEASDIVLLDDNFGSIVSAIEEGRSIYKTIKKVIIYLFSTSLGEVLAIAGAMLIGLPIPLTASQIIWLNFVTDGFLVAALAMEPKERNLLVARKSKDDRKMVTAAMFSRMILMGAAMMAGTLFVFGRYSDGDMVKAATMALVILAAFQWMNAFNCRSDKDSVFAMNPFRNKFLVAALAAVIALQVAAVYAPFFQSFLGTTALSFKEWLIAAVAALLIVVVDEFYKIGRRAFSRLA